MNLRNLMIWAIMILLLVALFNLLQPARETAGSEAIEYSRFIQLVENDQINRVIIDGDQIRSEGANPVRAIYPVEDNQLYQILRDNDVEFQVEPAPSGFNVFSWLLNIFPFLLLIGVWIYFMRQMQGGGRGGAMGFGKSKARLLTEKQGRLI
jgi:cell division protease FtsH